MHDRWKYLKAGPIDDNVGNMPCNINCPANGNTNVCLTHCRYIVHAIAHHGNVMALSAEVGDVCLLVLREHPRLHEGVARRAAMRVDASRVTQYPERRRFSVTR